LRLRARRQLETAAALEKPQYHVFTVEPRPLFDTRLEGNIHALKNRPAYTARGIRDDYSRLLSFSNSFYRDRDRRNVDWSFQFLPQEHRDHLEKHVPESNFESRENWIVAMKKEVDTVLLPMVKDRRPDPKGYKDAAAQFLASDNWWRI
jgi:hypothetical protein